MSRAPRPVPRVAWRLRRALAPLLLASACRPGADDPPACAPPDLSDTSPRPLWHFTPPDGWMNDPAGLVWLDDTFHLFYQRDPHEVFVADTRWGHATSADLLRWEDQPEALVADPVLGVPFTGSAVIDDSGQLCAPGVDCLVLIFTHALGQDGAQKQSVAFSDDGGATFTPYADNPVLPPIDAADFRDPNVRWHPALSRWVMTVGVRDAVRFYTSDDLRSWTQTGAFTPEGVTPGAYECPDLFSLVAPDGRARWVLKIDVNPGLLQAGPSRYWVGDFDGSTFTPTTAAEGLWTDGPDLYAAQTFAHAPDGRALWLGWMSAWSYANATPTEGYRGQQSTPRELALVDTPGGLRLAQRPARELDQATDDCPLLERESIDVDGLTPLLDDAGPAYVLTATLAPAAVAGFELARGAGERTVVGVDAARGAIFLDRSASGSVDFSDAFVGRVERPWPAPGASVHLTVLVDRTSVEVFADDGVTVISASIYPTLDARGLAAFAEGGPATVRDLTVRAVGRTLR
jgi:fructan beta-fructosidase